MTRRELQQLFERIDQDGQWVFTLQTLRLFFPNEPEKSIAQSMMRHTRDGLAHRICKGIYGAKTTRSALDDVAPLETISRYLQPGELRYLSLESLLHEAGMISQMPFRLTFVTTGRSYAYDTPFGTVEFVHSTRDATHFYEACEFDADRGLWLATPERALEDAARHRRNLDLIKEGWGKSA